MIGLAAATGCGSDRRVEREEQAARLEVASSESTATRVAARVAAVPSTGLWTEDHLLDRLVRAGVAPRRMDEPAAGPEWMGGPPIAYHAGGGMVLAWIFADSAARRAITDPLDPATAAPAGRVPPFESPMIFVVQNNLAAVITGGSETNQERIALALQAGLPVIPRTP